MKAVKEYYSNQFFISLQAHSRTYFEGFFILFFKQTAIYYLSFSQAIIDRIEVSESSFDDSWRRYLDVESASSNRDDNISILRTIVYVALGVNAVIFLLFFIDLIEYSLRETRKLSYDSSYSISSHLLSFLLKIYCYVVFIPSMYSSMRVNGYESSTVSVLNMIFSTIIGKKE